MRSSLFFIFVTFAVSGCGREQSSQTKDISLDTPNFRQILFLENSTVFLKTCKDSLGPSDRSCTSDGQLVMPESEYRRSLAEAYDIVGYEISDRQLNSLRLEIADVQNDIDSGTLTGNELRRAEARVQALRLVESNLAKPVEFMRYLESGVDTSVRDYRDDFEKLRFGFFNWRDVEGRLWRYAGEFNWSGAKGACDSLGAGWLMPNHKSADAARAISDYEATEVFTSRLKQSMQPIQIGNSGVGIAFWSFFDSNSSSGVYWFLLRNDNYARREITPRNGTTMSAICFKD